jgi:glycine/D-amino acid oxidase-like deaminating enzyme
MIVDTSGVYFHPEAENILVGWADPSEDPGYNFIYDEEKFFMEKIWPTLWNRIPATESLKHVTGWAGLYAESPDESAILGKSPKYENVFEAHSFSGRGAMQSPAIGLGLAEFLFHGEYKTLDLSPLKIERFETGELLTEGLVI